MTEFNYPLFVFTIYSEIQLWYDMTSRRSDKQMTRYEQEFMATVPMALRGIAKELKLMNKLKALEMKLNYDVVKRQGGVSLEYESDIDDIMEGRD